MQDSTIFPKLEFKSRSNPTLISSITRSLVKFDLIGTAEWQSTMQHKIVLQRICFCVFIVCDLFNSSSETVIYIDKLDSLGTVLLTSILITTPVLRGKYQVKCLCFLMYSVKKKRPKETTSSFLSIHHSLLQRVSLTRTFTNMMFLIVMGHSGFVCF